MNNFRFLKKGETVKVGDFWIQKGQDFSLRFEVAKLWVGSVVGDDLHGAVWDSYDTIRKLEIDFTKIP